MTAQRLDPRHSIFLDHWLRTFKGGPAAEAAGYAKSNAKQQACKILARADVQAEIERRHSRTLARFSITRTAIVAEQAKIGFASMGNYIRFENGIPLIDLERCTPDQLAAVQEITNETELVPDLSKPKPKKGERPHVMVGKVKLKLHDKLRGLELLGRPFGLSNINVRVTIDDIRPELDALSDEDLEALDGLLAKTLPATVIDAVATEIDDQQEEDDA